MDYQKFQAITLRNNSLKKMYPDVQQRKEYVQQRIERFKINNPVIIRIEPSPKVRFSNKHYTLVVKETGQMVRYIYQIIRDLNKDDVNAGIFLFLGKRLFHYHKPMTFLELKNNFAQEDGIVYLSYNAQYCFG